MSGRASGFTAVELLITLFVAATFLIAGYQLFNVVIVDGGDTRAESRAANVAYDYLRRFSETAPNPCTTLSPVAGESTEAEGLSDVEVTVTFSCVPGSPSSLSKVEVTVAYGVPQKQVTHSTYVDRSKDADTVTDVTSGLVGWWRMNGGSLASAVGPSTLTGTTGNAISATRDLVADRAFYFNGTNAQVTIPFDWSIRPTTALTASGWAYVTPALLAGTANYKMFSNTEAGGFNYALLNTNTLRASLYVNGAYYYSEVSESTAISNSWNLFTLTFDGTTLRHYINGSLVGSVAAAGSVTYSATAPFCIGAEPNATTCNSEYYLGSIDDVRIYNRALNATEIAQIYAGGER